MAQCCEFILLVKHLQERKSQKYVLHTFRPFIQLNTTALTIYSKMIAFRALIVFFCTSALKPDRKWSDFFSLKNTFQHIIAEIGIKAHIAYCWNQTGKPAIIAGNFENW